MSRRLTDGEQRKMRPAAHNVSPVFDVIAYREDADTPFVILVHRETGERFGMTDTDAKDTYDRIRHALSMLPSSK